MNRCKFGSALLVISTSIFNPGHAIAQEGVIKKGSPRPGVQQRVGAVERLLESRNDESITRFVEEQLSPTYRSSKSQSEWLSYLKEIRGTYKGFGTIRIAPSGDSGVALSFTQCPGEGIPLLLGIETASPHLINNLRLGERIQPPSKQNPDSATPRLSWDNLRKRLKAEEASGFSGSVLVVRDGAVVLHEGYGMANAEKKIPNGPDTIFAVGSTPIDFTKGAILKLEDMGKLQLSDPITKFLPNVPDDKKTITIDHLMTGRSGLRNFHGRPGDTDADNMWIDRETALKRMLEDELLFPPGSDRAHSHSAFGMLAAIIEMVSGEPYARFLEKHLFGPAGMRNTSHYEDIRSDENKVALGYGGEAYGPVNSPLHWGKTSWLVMGSGGMVSTTGDLYLWNKAIREAKVLSAKSAGKYFSKGKAFLTGGSMNGFFTAYTEGPGSIMYLCTNVIGRDRTEQLAEELATLVNKP